MLSIVYEKCKGDNMTKQEALLKIAQTALGDLLGYSQPPLGARDEYPFNAVAWRRTLPDEWQAEADEVLAYVYHHEAMPEGWVPYGGDQLERGGE